VAKGLCRVSKRPLRGTHPFWPTRGPRSDRSAGQRYKEAVRRWLLPTDLPVAVADLIVAPCQPEHFQECDLVFSGLDSSVAGDVGRQRAAAAAAGWAGPWLTRSTLPATCLPSPTEAAFVARDIPVFSNAKNYRMTDDVPLVVPTVNSDHLRAIPAQRRRRGLRRGFLVCNANCSTTGLVVALRPLEAGRCDQEEQDRDGSVC